MSYSGDPSASTLDEVRFLVGDTSNDPASEKLTDDEVNYLIAKWGEPMKAAHAAASQLASSYAGRMNKSIGQTRLEYSTLYQQYVALAKELARRGGFSSIAMTAVPVAGGLAGASRDDGTVITLDMDVNWRNEQDP